MITERKGLISGCPYYPSFTNDTHLTTKNNICGSSSSEVLRRNFPTLVMYCSGFLSIIGWRSRRAHFHAAKLQYFTQLFTLPTRFLLKRTGPGSSITIANVIKINSHDKRIIPRKERIISKKRLKNALYINGTSIKLITLTLMR